ncbi:WD40-repeat-containing domain protein [Scheffersomyces coipomensis]|uniref:WD40-repeat-containing domain protein n=1 Tax=Scheffersomyces coipomensis TaxID=1788519 RepID=UPI00315D2C83
MAPIQERIAAFPDGNSLISIQKSRLIVGNSEGLIKIYDLDQLDLEPKSIDIDNNITSLVQSQDLLFISNTNGQFQVIDLKNYLDHSIDIVVKTIYRSELPLRSIQSIPTLNQVVVGGDDRKLVFLDTSSSEFKAIKTLDLNDSIVDLSLGLNNSLIISLSNGEVKFYDVDGFGDDDDFTFKKSDMITTKILTSLDTIDYKNDHQDELVATKIHALKNGNFLIPANDGPSSIKLYSSTYQEITEIKDIESSGSIRSTHINDQESLIAVLYSDDTVKIFNLINYKLEHRFPISLNDNNIAINLQWFKYDLYFGTTNGEIIYFKQVGKEITTTTSTTTTSTEAIISAASGLFIDDATEDTDEEEYEKIAKRDRSKVQEEDSMIIDQDDDINDNDDEGLFGDDLDGDNYGDNKRFKSSKKYTNGGSSTSSSYFTSHTEVEEFQPYSPGSTPWIQDSKSDNSGSVERRYLGINTVGHVWAVRNSGYDQQQQHLTISFYDRSIQKDYHFTDHFKFDLCSFNNRGLLLGYSGINEKKNNDHGGKIYYRHHDSETDSWEKTIPLLKDEIITGVCLSNTSSQSSSIITVGTSLGYLRFFNLYGVCINVLKVQPIYALISSSTSNLFTVNQIANNIYTFSLIDINQDYNFIQQDVLLPIKRKSNEKLLLKGLFFNEYNDPCIISNQDDTLLILQTWRDSNNSKWIPILNCNNVITEYGSNPNKKNWKCWPLGLYNDQLNCLILKNNNPYPGFPLPLPVELKIRLPIQVHSINKENGSLKKKKKKKNPDDILDEDDEEEEEEDDDLMDTDGSEQIKNLFNDNDDPEENFLRSLTMGKIISDSLNDEAIGGDDDENDEIMDRLTKYSILFDKSLLKLFAESCKDSKLNKALSIAKLIKTDKALLAASKIAERMEFINLSTKIGKLREDLLDIDDDEDEDDI